MEEKQQASTTKIILYVAVLFLLLNGVLYVAVNMGKRHGGNTPAAETPETTAPAIEDPS